MIVNAATRMGETDWEQVARDLAPIAADTSPKLRKRKSRDYYWFSPILKPQLDNVLADLVVTPKTSEEVTQVVAYCAAHSLPITVRGGGTGNYGQSMPMQGGIVLDITRLDQLLWVRDNVYCAQAGIKMYDLEGLLNAQGWEQRLFPSTWRSATLGGFIAGGTSGCGAIGYGTLHSGDNVRALKVLTIEPEPRILELRGKAAQAVVHAYGTNGIILEAELALAPLRRWHDRVVALPDLPTALRLAEWIGTDRTIAKKQLTILGEATAGLVKPIAAVVPAGRPVLIAMIEQGSLATFESRVKAVGGAIAFARAPDEQVSGMPPIYETCWNHTTLHAIGSDPSITYLQSSFGPDWVEAVAAADAELGDEVPLHLELATIDGALVCFGLSLLRFTSVERLEQIHATLRRHGCTIFNPHTYVLENGGLQIADPIQLAFRKSSDPLGLLNPGKMPEWDVPARI